MGNLIHYHWPAFLEQSAAYTLCVDGEPVRVHPTQSEHYAIFSMNGPVQIRLTCPKPVEKAVLRPARAGVTLQKDSQELQFTIPKPGNFLLEIPGMPSLFLYANPPEENIPDRNDPAVVWFTAGQVYDVGTLEVTAGQTVYIEGGAVLKGCIHALAAENITVRGRGVIDASHLPHHAQRMVVFEGCANVTLEGILTTGTPSWNTVFGRCRQVHVDNYKTIGWVVCSDGIDIVGSQDVLIENCCIRANDDCIVVKSVNYHKRLDPNRPDWQGEIDWRGDVKNVVARNCVLYNAEAGNVMEIGFETQTERIGDIAFENIDVIGAHGQGGVFTIHNGDRALITNVRYENIHIEHFYDKLVDFFIQHSRYSKDDQRGRVENIVFKDIYTIEDQFNTISLMGGYDEEHTISKIRFENFNIGSKRVLSPDDLNLYFRHTQELSFS